MVDGVAPPRHDSHPRRAPDALCPCRWKSVRLWRLLRMARRSDAIHLIGCRFDKLEALSPPKGKACVTYLLKTAGAVAGSKS